jgi:hypothetical protein
MRLTFFVILVACLVLPSLAAAAGVGIPASLVGKENYGFTAEVENQKKEIEGDPVESRRYLGRVIWGATDWMDVYARLGASDLKVRAAESPAFEGNDGMTYGGGLTVRVLDTDDPDITGLFSVQALSYYSKGSMVVPETYDGDIVVYKYDNRYRWSEIQFSVLAAWERDVWRPYIGLSVTNAFGSVRKKVYRNISGDYDYYGRKSNKFSEAAIPEMVLGLDVGIGGTGELSGEVRIGGDHLSFVLGLSELYR